MPFGILRIATSLDTMKMRLELSFGILLVITACHVKPKTEGSQVNVAMELAIADSAYSVFYKNSMTFKNVSYSEEEFNYKNELRKFICKTTATSIGKSEGLRPYREKREFYDYDMNKVFEINAEQRTIDIQPDYYITEGLTHELPRYFEYNNYLTGEPFVRCTGVVWTVSVPNSETTAFFGYRSNQNRRDTLTIGEYYFSMNQHKNVKLIVKASNEKLRKRISSNLPFRLESNNSIDFVRGRTNLHLKSQEGNTGLKSFTNFNLIVKVPYDMSDNNWKNNRFIEYTVPIVDGELKAEKISDDVYVYTIKE